MQRRNIALVVGFVALLALVGLGGVAQAQSTYYWDTTAGSMIGGSGTWSTTAYNWSSSTGGSNPLLVWAPGNNAEFTTGSGTVTLDPANPLSVGSLTVDNGTNYTFSSGTIQAGYVNVSGTSSYTIGGLLSTTNASNGINVASNGVFNATFSGGTISNAAGNGLYAYSGGIVNLTVPSAGGTIVGNLQSNLVATINANFSGGGVLKVSSLTDYGADTWSLNGAGQLNDAGGFNINGKPLTLSVSGGASLVTAGAITANAGATVNATLNGGTIQSSGNALNVSGGTANVTFNTPTDLLYASSGINVTSTGVFTANLSGGTVYAGGSNGIYTQASSAIANFNVGSAGGAITSSLVTNFGGQFNVGFTGSGGVLNLSGNMINYASAPWSLSGSGTLNAAGQLSVQGGVATVSVSGGATLVANNTVTVNSGCGINATLTSGTIQTTYVSNSGTSSFTLNSGGLLSTTNASNGINVGSGVFNANFNGGTISTAAGNGLYAYGSGTANISVSSGMSQLLLKLTLAS